MLPFFQKLVVGIDVLGRKEGEGGGEEGGGGRTHRALHYVALEMEEALFAQNCRALEDAGFVDSASPVGAGAADEDTACNASKRDMATFTWSCPAEGGGGGGSEEGQTVAVTVSLLRKDFRQLQPRTLGPIHLFVAACFADLMAPDDLVRTLLRLSAGLAASTLVSTRTRAHARTNTRTHTHTYRYMLSLYLSPAMHYPPHHCH